MSLETAPSANSGEDEEPIECDVCGGEDTFVLYDNDKVCQNCGYLPTGTSKVEVETISDEWSQWHDHRRDEYSGFTGEDRIKMVGGFAAAYFD